MGTRPEGGSRPSTSRRLTLGRILALVALGPAIVVIASVVVGILTIAHQNSVRDELISRVEPANAAALRLQIALLNEETGIRGYELTGQSAFLQPYHLGVTQARTYEADLRGYAVPGVAADLATALADVQVWETRTARPALREGTAARQSLDASVTAKHEFDAIRTGPSRRAGPWSGARCPAVGPAACSARSGSHRTRAWP
jgi:CHASE3 domain sensor protein